MTILLLLSSLALGLLLWSRRGSALDRAARELREARTQPGKRLRLASPDRPVEEIGSCWPRSTACWRTGSRRPGHCESRRRASAGRSPTSPMTCAPPSPPFWAISSFWNPSGSPLSSGGTTWRSCPTGPGCSRT